MKHEQCIETPWWPHNNYSSLIMIRAMWCTSAPSVTPEKLTQASYKLKQVFYAGGCLL